MKANIKWLQQYVDLSDLSPQEVSDTLTMIGLEVDDLYDRFSYLEKVVSARLVEVQPMPKSDHLKICRVDAGGYGSFQIVCGAPNARAGIVAPLALVGAKLPGDFVIKAAELRGHRSEGMLCSSKELAIGDETSGIMELDADAGRSMKEITGLEDWSMEIGITPNRADGLSIIGLARDLAAALNRPLKTPLVQVKESGPQIETLANVTIEAPEHNPRYVARVIKGVKIGPSPKWLVERLASVDIRSISNAVDVTNFVMHEMGQPLHAFDLRDVAGSHIIVKSYPKGSRFTTLDGQDRELKSEVNLMICDEEKPVGLAGIMGGLNSEIKDDTTDILLESAYFNQSTIRKTSRALGLSTDASYRYERGCDPEICAVAVDRAIALIQELAGGEVATGRIDRYPAPFKAVEVTFSPEKCNKFIGTRHKAEDMIRVLEGIGIKVLERQGDAYRLSLPSWRPDLSREVDVWEEVTRLLEFDKIPVTLPQPPVQRQAPPASWNLRNMVREHLVFCGFSECISYSFLNPNVADKLNLAHDSEWRTRMLPILNPLSQDQGSMRPLLAPCLLSVLRLNQNHGQKQVAVFELGATFLSNGLDQQPSEKQSIAGLWAGVLGSGNWNDKERNVDFWDIKGVIESLAEQLNLKIYFSREGDIPPWYDVSEAAFVYLENGCRLGHLGRLNKKAAKKFSIKDNIGAVYMFELDAEAILAQGLQARPFKGWSKFPAAERDIALVLDKNITAAEVSAAILDHKSMSLEKIDIFDIYEGDQLPEGKKSLAFRLTFQDDSRTLTDEEVNSYFNVISAHLNSKFGATLRS